eukprot:6481986-Amphidinium_carterae.2
MPLLLCGTGCRLAASAGRQLRSEECVCLFMGVTLRGSVNSQLSSSCQLRGATIEVQGGTRLSHSFMLCLTRSCHVEQRRTLAACGVELHAAKGFLVLGQDRVPIARRRGVYEHSARLVPSGHLLPAEAALDPFGFQELLLNVLAGEANSARSDREPSYREDRQDVLMFGYRT